MTDLAKLARGEDCQIRVPGVCLRSNETVVCCHVRMAGISGYGLKAADALAAWGCQACHDFVDNRASTSDGTTYEERRALLLDGMARTQNILIERGILKW